MNHNMCLYRRLNPRLLVQEGVNLSLLHWANISNISLTEARNKIRIRNNKRPAIRDRFVLDSRSTRESIKDLK